MKSPQVHLILGCTRESSPAIGEYVSMLDGSAIVVGNDRDAIDAIRSQGCEAAVLEELFPLDSEPDLQAYERAYQFLDRLESRMTAVTYRRVPIYPALEEWLFNSLVILDKATSAIHRLERSTDHVVFAFSAYAHNYLALLDLAAAEGRTPPDELCLSARSGRLVPWDEYAEHRIADRMATSWNGDQRRVADITPSDVQRRRPATGHPGRGSHITTLFFMRSNEYVLYLKPIYPVLDAFRRHGAPFIVLTKDPLVVRSLERIGVSTTLLHDLAGEAVDTLHVRRMHDETLKRLDACLGTVSSEFESSHPIGSALLPYCSGDSFHELVLENLRLVDVLIDVIRSSRPRSIMLVPDAIPTARVVAGVARRFGIPTFATLAGSVSHLIRHLGKYSCDMIAIAGQDDLDAFLKAGYDRSRLVMTGSPMFDSIAAASAEHDRAVVMERLPLDSDKKVVLIAGSRIDPNEPQWIRAFAVAAQRRGDVEIVVKAHPNYPIERYSDVVTLTQGLPVHVVRDIDLHPLLNISSAVITDYSHAGKEALLFGKPLVVVNLTGTPYPTNRYEELGVALYVKELGQVAAVLDAVLDDEDLQHRLAKARSEVVVPRYNHLNDGMASERLFDLLAREQDIPPVLESSALKGA